MANTETCSTIEKFDGRDCDTSLPVDPFEALKPHFGMLLGVQDFQTIDAYHRGKQWLHNAWLHGQGVVWGLQVSIDTDNNEVKVKPGLAIDALGRELYLPKPVCLNVPQWLEKHRDDEEFKDVFVQDEEGNVNFTVHVVIQFRACLARQVPALMEPCEGGSATTAYSRVLETVQVMLKPGLAPVIGTAERKRSFHRLRLLFKLEDPIEEQGAIIPADQEVIAERNRILSLPIQDQAHEYLLAFRQFAAKDEMDLKPASNVEDETVSLFPATEPSPLVLANLMDLQVKQDDLQMGTVDNLVRDVLLDTSTIQELLNGPLFNPALAIDENGDEVPQEESTDADGPRIDPDLININSDTLDFVHTGTELLKRSVQGDVSVFVSTYEVSSGWTRETISGIEFVDSTVKISLNRDEALNADLVRLVVKGTGSTPVLGKNRVPLAGSLGGPSGTQHEGHDFVFLLNQEE